MRFSIHQDNELASRAATADTTVAEPPNPPSLPTPSSPSALTPDPAPLGPLLVNTMVPLAVPSSIEALSTRAHGVAHGPALLEGLAMINH